MSDFPEAALPKRSIQKHLDESSLNLASRIVGAQRVLDSATRAYAEGATVEQLFEYIGEALYALDPWGGDDDEADEGASETQAHSDAPPPPQLP